MQSLPDSGATGTVPPAVLLDRVSLSYDGEQVFEELSLKLEGGRCTCLLGPSGCGKSTLLRLISGDRSLRYRGGIDFDPSLQGNRRCAWMSQDDLLLPWMTVENNVLLGARLRGEVRPQLRARAVGMLEDAGLADYRYQLPAALSGGMRQRVALLRTLMEGCPVLLMDEPFSALDALTRIRLQDMAAAVTAGKTVLLVTHDPLEALRLGDTIVVLAGSPARVAGIFRPGGPTPRPSDDALIVEYYPGLLELLLRPSSAAPGAAGVTRCP